MALPIAYEARLAECGSKHMALYQALRDAIAGGLLPPGEKLPSTRALAAMYGLSRGSVNLAYEMLAAEGYVRTGVGQGTFAAGAAGTAARIPGGTAAAQPDLSAWGRRLMEIGGSDESDETDESDEGYVPATSLPGAEMEEAPLSFVPRNIGERWFPWAEWRSAVASVWPGSKGNREPPSAPAAGSLELRRAIAGRLRRERGILCDAGHVVLTGGSMQAIALLSQLLLEKGRTAVAEDPGYTGIRMAAQAAGAAVAAGAVDDGGIVPRDWDADVLFVTPTRQYPTGAVLAYERRLALLEWASRRGAWIVEDDYDSDFRWGGRPIEPLKSLDREDRVVYVGTFSRSLRTDIRIGFAVVPSALRDAFVAAKRLYEPHPTGLTEQRALAVWMAQGGYDRHMRRMRRIYGRLQGTLRRLMEEKLGEWFRVVPSDAGLHLYAVWRKNEVEYERLRQACRSFGVEWKDAGLYRLDPRSSPPSGIFGFAHLDEEQIGEGVARIRRAADSLGL
ncbi:PLP-dependent aminotransferase family protein [Cohnella caldifontis]|uniref:MocR-like pyridoxine biosynthesis transcription factor PdxR n=1 Tax=Cohnella caldifontis TaxID=3027471 RepID=UPI0023EDDE7B|nr:PLP-dependent aminotransferase family protein [Cohnella sp. YIM B05605]